MRFEQGAERFSGTVRNTTSQIVRDVRVEIHLSNGVELGPTPRVNPGGGETVRSSATRAARPPIGGPSMWSWGQVRASNEENSGTGRDGCRCGAAKPECAPAMSIPGALRIPILRIVTGQGAGGLLPASQPQIAYRPALPRKSA